MKYFMTHTIERERKRRRGGRIQGRHTESGKFHSSHTQHGVCQRSRRSDRGLGEAILHLSESIREIQLASEKANTNMNNIVRDGLASEGAQERRIQEMHEGLTQFLERCEPAHLTAPRRFETPVASTPFMPSANLLIGMTMGQLDDYALLVARLSRRYDPPEREEAHRRVVCTHKMPE